MPNAKITHVVSFSSEDSSFPAENLTVGLTYKKWKCKTKGEPQSFVILQLEKAVTICGVDIGNECSAFVEVLVGRSGGAIDDFKTLVPASSFMSAMESKNVTSANRVRIFGSEELTKPACCEKWDRIKVICTQPFNKGVQYGLSFLTVHMPENKDDNTEIGNLGRFTIKKNDAEDISIGSLFSKPKEQESFRGVAGQIRDANRSPQIHSQTKLLPMTKAKEIPRIKVKDTPEAKKIAPLPKNTEREAEKPRSSKEKMKVDTTSKRKATPPLVSPKQRPKRTKTTPPKLCKPFVKLLDGVVFVISGYQNPNRQILRDKALAMGAKYKPDWCPGCTHLICAFPNTPKFNQVRGKGKIVGKQWIEDCHADRKRLPWRQYAVDRNDRGKDESEEEICEEILIATASTSIEIEDEDDFTRMTVNNAHCLDSGSDTDDEIERVKQASLREIEEKSRKERELKQAEKEKKLKQAEKEKKLKQAEKENKDLVKKDFVIEESPDNSDEELKRIKQESLPEAKARKEDAPKNKSPANFGDGSDTDKDEPESLPDTSHLPLPALPDFFQSKTFYLHNELSTDTKAELNRYVIAFGGEVLDSLDNPRIDYLLAENGTDIKNVTSIHPDIIAVAPEWMWECNDAEKLLPTANYKIEV